MEITPQLLDKIAPIVESLHEQESRAYYELADRIGHTSAGDVFKALSTRHGIVGTMSQSICKKYGHGTSPEIIKAPDFVSAINFQPLPFHPATN